MRIAGFEIALRPLENLDLKLISLALALGLWSLVPNTTTPHQIRGVPVRLEGIPPDLALAEPFNATLDVVVVGPSARARDLIPGQLSPRIDLFGAHAGENTITLTPADIPAPFGVDVESVEPARVVVRLEQRLRALRPVSAVVEGDPAPGYVIGDKTTDPAVVTVVGPRSRVEALESVATEVISVSGEEAPVTRRVTVITNDPLIEIDGDSTVRLTIGIDEVPVTLQLEELEVEIVGATTRVAVNPDRVGLVLRGPPSVIEGVGAGNVRIVLDVSGLQPRAEDYAVGPTVVFEPADLATRLEVIALTPQRRLDVHVFERP